MLDEVGNVRGCVDEFVEFNQKKSLKENIESAWEFWCSLHRRKLINAWWDAVCIVSLLHPCSIDAEKIFSVAKGNVKSTQGKMSADKQEIGTLLSFNGIKTH